MAHDPMVVKLHKVLEESGQVASSHIVSLKPKASAREPSRAPETAAESSSAAQHAQANAARMPARRSKRRVPGFVVVLGVALLLIVALGMYLSRLSVPSAQVSAAGENVDGLVAHVGTLILLPQGEVPTVATVSDLNALKGQAFFDHASLGDKVLMYPKAQEAVLYDPQQDKVIQVGPLTVSQSAK